MARIKLIQGLCWRCRRDSLWVRKPWRTTSLLKIQEDPKPWVMPLGNMRARVTAASTAHKKNVKDLQVAWDFSTGVLRAMRVDRCHRQHEYVQRRSPKRVRAQTPARLASHMEV